MEKYNINQKIYMLRKQKRLTQRQLAKKINLSQSIIRDIEARKNKLQKIDTVDKILNAFNVSFDFLYKDYLTVFKNRKLKNLI